MPYTGSNGTNPASGIFFEDSYGFGNTVSAPTTMPSGGSINGSIYVFDHWTIDPVSSSNADVFANGGVLVEDLPYIYLSSAGYAIAKLYAVYTNISTNEDLTSVYSEHKDLTNEVKESFTFTDAGQYFISAIASGTCNAPNVAVRVDVQGAGGVITTIVSVVPLTYSTMYCSSVFTAIAGDTVNICYYQQVANLQRDVLDVKIYYLIP